jgi:hypothetical protein
VTVGGVKGPFVLDWDADWSSFDPAHLPGIKLEKSSSHEGMYHFDSGLAPLDTDPADLAADSRSYLQNVKQAGVVGTDFLTEQIYTVAYGIHSLYKAQREKFCSPPVLLSAGFRPVTGVGYFAFDFATVQNTLKHQNVATAPVQFGSVRTWAELDTADADLYFPHSVSINRALFKLLDDQHLLVPLKTSTTTTSNTTCAKDANGAPILEPLVPYKLVPSAPFSLITEDGGSIQRAFEITILLKETPPEARSCAGIGSRAMPMAQIGASVLSSFAAIAFDPFASRYWFQVN